MLDLGAVDIEQLPKDIIDKKLVGSLRVLALRKRGNRLAVAVSDPTNYTRTRPDQVSDAACNRRHRRRARQVDAAVEARRRASISSSTRLAVAAKTSISAMLDESRRGFGRGRRAAADVDDAPVVRFLQKLLLDAIGEGASDLHFEPYEKFYRVRFRLDGHDA